MAIVELSKIAADQSAQPRCAIDVDRVAEYTEDMDRGDKFPPLVVFNDRKRYWLADGFHRFYAAINGGLQQIECDVREGGLRDAVLYSCGANAQHGARRTPEDKRRAVSRMLLDDEWGGWSDREIGRRCAVSKELVRVIRSELMEKLHTGSSASIQPKRTFTHPATGETTAMDTSNIGKSSPSSELPDGPLIGKCLREIERYMDMMPTPNDAVRHFPEDQYYLFPLSKIEAMAQWFALFAASWRAKIVEKARGA